MARTYYAYAKPNSAGIIEIENDEFNHLVNTLRIKLGDDFLCFDGNGNAWKAKVNSIERRKLTAVVINTLIKQEIRIPYITVAVGVIKSQRMEVAVEKAAELGAVRFIPLLSEFNVVNPGEGKLKRYQDIAISAAKQSHRYHVMEVSDAIDFKGFIEKSNPSTTVCLDLNNESVSILSALQRLSYPEQITLIIGPEGGFSECERDLMRAHNISFAIMGEFIQRTESAVTTSIAIVKEMYSIR